MYFNEEFNYKLHFQNVFQLLLTITLERQTVQLGFDENYYKIHYS